MKFEKFLQSVAGRMVCSAEGDATDGGGTAVAEPSKFNAKEFLAKFKDADVVAVATAMATATSDEEKYALAKLMVEKTKTTYIDPMKELRDKEKLDEQKVAEARAAKVAEYRDRLNKLVSEEVIDEFGTIAADYIEAGHGQLISLEINAKKDPETGKVKVEFSSNIQKARARSATSTRTRESGATGAGVTVNGGPAEGKKGPNGQIGQTLTEVTQYKSFAEAARSLGVVDDSTEMKGLNCKRLLESLGYECDYVQAAEAPAPTPSAA